MKGKSNENFCLAEGDKHLASLLNNLSFMDRKNNFAKNENQIMNQSYFFQSKQLKELGLWYTL